MFGSTATRRGLTSALSLATIAALLAGPFAGNAAAAPKPRTPAPTITSAPASLTSSRTATFAFEDTAGNVRFTCSLDNGGFNTCTSPKTYSGLSDGAHRFRVNAKAAKRPRSTNTSYTWTIDTDAPPGVTFNNVPAAGTWVATSPAITFSSQGDAVSFTCSIDGGTATACTSGSTGTAAVTADGVHTLTVVPRDAAGNPGPSATATWRLDAVDPMVVVVGPGSATNDTTPTFTITASDNHGVDSVMCTLDADPAVDCSGGTFTPSALSAATHTFAVTVTDVAGRTTTANYTPIPDAAPGFEVDTAVPAVTFSTPPAAYTDDATPSFSFVADDLDNNVDALECALDPTGASGTWTWADCSTDPAGQHRAGTFTAATDLADGSHTLYIRATDAAANESVQSTAFVVDTTDPVLTVTGLPSGFTNQTTAHPAIQVSDANATMPTCTLNGDPIADCAVLGTLSDGLQTYVVTETDLAGNTVQVTKQWVVDTVRPTVASFVSPTTLTGAGVVRFSEPVTAAAPSRLAIRVTSSGRAVPVSRACLTATGVTTPCSGTFRQVRLTPVKPLVPGQYYRLTAGAGAVQDLAGNLSQSTGGPEFRAPTRLNESSVAARYTWQRVAASAAYKGSYVRDHRRGSTATYRFSGSSLTWWTVTGPAQGKARVFLDGKKLRTVNNYAAATHFRVARSFIGLGAGAHTVTIRVLGVKGAKAGKGTYVAVDAFTARGNLVRSPSLRGAWGLVSGSKYAGGKARVGDLRGQSVSVKFRGTGFTWITALNRRQGVAKVYVDGALAKTFTNTSATSKFGVRRVVSGLADRTHTVRIVIAGKARGPHQLTVDGFRVQ